ncbi:hypothetical protein [Elongatibacter sediminis]|uniref:Uncharacterized protein n=1 Tax=Elongatibacter sediminis TaxID=3119006 RepID=A0AAW9RIP9_9GAMM
MSGEAAILHIASRFCGPPQSGNGGYVSGSLAAFVTGDCRVRLLRPPPLERDLVVHTDADGVTLMDGPDLIARAQPHTLDLTPPAAPEFEEAVSRSRHYPGLSRHAFGTCFVCGPDRAVGDGLRIFPGPGDDGRVACTWVPDASLCDDHGQVLAPFVWAALDCPGGWAWISGGDRVAVLGEFAVHIDGTLHSGEDYIIVGWTIGDDGRKHHCGSALYSATGKPLAWAASTWFDVVPAQMGA